MNSIQRISKPPEQAIGRTKSLGKSHSIAAREDSKCPLQAFQSLRNHFASFTPRTTSVAIISAKSGRTSETVWHHVKDSGAPSIADTWSEP